MSNIIETTGIFERNLPKLQDSSVVPAETIERIVNLAGQYFPDNIEDTALKGIRTTRAEIVRKEIKDIYADNKDWKLPS